LMYFASLLGYSKSKAEQIANELLGKIGLSDDANRRVADYSGGMKKKLELATALFPGIKVLILDEPTTGLDPSARRTFLGSIKELKGEDTTILLVTHIGADAELASRVGLMDEGKIIAEDSPDGLKQASGLTNVIDVETSIKNTKVAKALMRFGNQKILETELGYRIFCSDAEKTAPELVRSLDIVGCKVTKIEITKPSLEDVFFKLTEKPVRKVN
jgi:ABC-2 type transport system ATP-binding protein